MSADPAYATRSAPRTIRVTAPQSVQPDIPTRLRAWLYVFEVVAAPRVGLHSLSLTKPARGYTLAQYARDISAHPARTPRATTGSRQG